MIMGKYHHSLCSLYNQIYSIGGFNVSYIAECEVFSIKSNIWKSLPNLSTPRGLCAAVIYGKQWVYAIAGTDENDDINTVERLQIFGAGAWANVNI